MLVVNSHTLKTINVLNLVDNVLLYGSRALDSKNIAWSHNTIRKRCTSTNGIMLLNQNLLRKRYEILFLVASLGCNNNLTVTTLYLTHGNLTVDFRNNSRV